MDPPKYEENVQSSIPNQQVEMTQPQNHQPQVNVNVNVNKKVNHCFYGLMTFLTCGACSLCWCGACCGCCPTCE